MKSNENTKRLYEKISLFRTSNEVSGNSLKNKINIPNTSEIISNDSFSLLLTTIKVLQGESGLIDTINNMNKDISKYQKNFNSKFVMEYISEMGGDDKLPLYKDYIDNGFKINITTLDKHREFFKDNIIQNKNSLDSFIYSLIRNPNKDVMYVNDIFFNYNNINGDIYIKFTNNDTTMKDVINGFLNKTTKYNSDDILYDILDDMFNLSNKSPIYLKEKYENDLILINDISTTIDNSYYEFTREDIKFIEEKITKTGFYYYGTPEIDGSFNMEDYNEFINSPNTFNVSPLTIIMDIVLRGVLPKYIEIARKNFFERFINSYKNVLLNKIIVSTDMILLYNLCFRGENLDKSGLLKKNRDLIRCSSKTFINSLLNTLYKIVKREILKLITTATIAYTKESITKYRKILTSLRLF